MKNMRRLAPAFVVLGVCVFIVSVWLSHIPSDAPSSSGSFNGSDSSPQYPGQADFAKSQDSFPASAAKSQKVANGSVEVKRKSPKTHEEVHAEYLQLVKELQSLNIAEAPALPLYNDCKRKLDDCDDALSENSSDVESILKQKCRVSEGLYLRLTDLANNSALWPVTNHYYANEAAKIYIACLKEYVPTCSSTEEAVTVYTNLGGLLDTYPEEVPGFEQKINSGMCFEKAFDLALDTGLCDLAEATMGAERFASGYDFDRAVRLLEKAISSCNSGRYVVRNYGPLTTSSEKAAAIKDLTNLIKEYESKKNSVDIGASKARIASFNDKSEKSRQAGLEREKLNYGVPVLKESLSGYKRWLFEKNYIESMKRDPVYKLLVEKRLAEQQLSGVPDLNSTAAHSSSVPSDSASSSAEQSSGSDSLFFALDRKSRSSDPEVNIEGLRQLEDFQPDDSGYPDSFAIATLKARFFSESSTFGRSCRDAQRFFEDESAR